MEYVIAVVLVALILIGLWDVSQWLADHLPPKGRIVVMVGAAALIVGLTIWG